ncbi:hypothetical protein [Devosia sp. SL43]|uniref:hypothetical protein n=1 Tax=Devosia sp. SL43 TaxID=2806348 RepID=UPI001F210FBC|nr:hypothetical protein [Devosia sp. SL43]UJW86912.1 hypothetical protein IM737_06615 [Devosia sp. SL43]
MAIKTLPPAFRNEPFRSLSTGAHMFQSEVLETLDLTLAEFSAIRVEGYLRSITPFCATPQYRRSKVISFMWGLQTNQRHADTIAFLIGRRGDGWANGGDAR